jgi:hypothetical protein
MSLDYESVYRKRRKTPTTGFTFEKFDKSLDTLYALHSHLVALEKRKSEKRKADRRKRRKR